MKNAKSGLPAGVDGTADNHCLRRPKCKLVHIGLSERSPMEQEDWIKDTETAETHPRVRAVQMHMQNITKIPPLTLSMCPCEYVRSPSAAVALKGLHAGEIDRTWIYDTGAGACFIGCEYLTASERKRTFNAQPSTFITLAGELAQIQRLCVTFPTLVKDSATS